MYKRQEASHTRSLLNTGPPVITPTKLLKPKTANKNRVGMNIGKSENHITLQH